MIPYSMFETSANCFQNLGELDVSKTNRISGDPDRIKHVSNQVLRVVTNGQHEAVANCHTLSDTGRKSVNGFKLSAEQYAKNIWEGIAVKDDLPVRGKLINLLIL